MITGQTKVPRYYPFFEPSFAYFKELMLEQYPKVDRKKIQEAKNCEQLYNLVGHDFFVITPCHSTCSTGRKMEGTRLTIQKVDPEGWEYSIRTPGTPDRTTEFSEELTHAFEALTEAVRNNRDIIEITTRILTICFYWYAFMPLTRGSAACGLMVLHGLLLSVGYELPEPVPEGRQPDWDGILRPDPASFIEASKDWVFPNLTPSQLNVPLVAEHFPTIRHMIQALNWP